MESTLTDTLLNRTLGALELSTFITSILYGVTILQTYIYFHQDSHDPVWLKCSIVCLWIFDTSHQAFSCHSSYTYTVTYFGNVIALNNVIWSIYAMVYLTGLTDLLARGILCARIWKFDQKAHIPVMMIMLCSVGECAGMIAFAIKKEQSPDAQFIVARSLSVDFYTGLGFGIVADLVLAGTQVVIFYKQCGRIKRTKSIIHTLMLYSINTGLVTSLCAILECITWGAMPNTLVYVVFYTVTPQLLTNALLATLNARQDLRDAAKGGSGLLSIPLSSIAPSSAAAVVTIGGSHRDKEVDHVPMDFKIDRMDDTF
ncbi:hypothetical protein CERSUDRAFT_118807 [Gelatoporia subvermispora B]|uniref:DUF6534 domain-containing protein n=1 Tax=Ceriporiopsis subvermispora (strain B) TaxID=914234 RepID=M2PAF2_CERS8|nr:hypothetical protein CERSUDRAFT_118807 [Gelatoporia subvermispora B]